MNYKVNISEALNDVLKSHLIRPDGQEDLCFALYNPITAMNTTAAVLFEIILPEHGDRDVHGNVSFSSEYLDRVGMIAREKKCGICFMHSHPANGWQGMSRDDVDAENMLAPRCKAMTGLPLLGMTIGEDGVWSARFWIKDKPKSYRRHFCSKVCVSGKKLQVSYYDELEPRAHFGVEFTRTISAWGQEKQDQISRLCVGIVGLGSVGSIIAEALIKTGVRKLILLDFDTVERKNLDRLQGIGPDQVGQHKVHAIKKHLEKISPGLEISIISLPYSLVESEGLLAMLACDVIFSCVDRPWPRYVLNKISYANAIPIIDGGIDANQNKKRDNIGQARWKSHVTAPGRICLSCLGQYSPEDVSLEMSGLLENLHYIQGLPEEHFAKRGENVFAFSLGLAGMEIQQFLSLNLQPRGIYYGPKEFDFNTGNIDSDFDFNCKVGCEYQELIGQGDKVNASLTSQHPIAEEKRKLAISQMEEDLQKENCIERFIFGLLGRRSWIAKMFKTKY